MKRILRIAVVLGLMCSVILITGCSKGKEPQVKEEPTSVKVAAIPKEKDIMEEPTKRESSRKEEVIELGKDVKLELVLIPAGKFKMGSPASEKGHRDNETQHEVTLTKPFYMGKYEVTQEQWESVMGKNPSDTKGSKLPVTNVS
jgi:formylglycine-generating enzyme required for sulfatase activity